MPALLGRSSGGTNFDDETPGSPVRSPREPIFHVIATERL